VIQQTDALNALRLYESSKAAISGKYELIGSDDELAQHFFLRKCTEADVDECDIACIKGMTIMDLMIYKALKTYETLHILLSDVQALTFLLHKMKNLKSQIRPDEEDDTHRGHCFAICIYH